MAGYHKIVVVGNLSRDPAARYTPGGRLVTNVTIPPARMVSKEVCPECPAGWSEYKRWWQLTTWWTIAFWGKLAENANELLGKGSAVYVEAEVAGRAVNGSQHPRTWVGQDGQPRANFEATARFFKVLKSNGAGGFGEPSAPPPGFEGEEDLVPF